VPSVALFARRALACEGREIAQPGPQLRNVFALTLDTQKLLLQAHNILSVLFDLLLDLASCSISAWSVENVLPALHNLPKE
jgi:hypothetical protein